MSSDTDAMIEEAKQITEDKLTLVVQMVPAFGLKELSVYAESDQLIQTGKKFTFELDESIFNAIDIDESKCQKYRKDSTQIKICINYKATLETCEYDKYIQHLLEHIAGTADNLRFTNKNQFDFVYLCELFKVSLPSLFFNVKLIYTYHHFINDCCRWKT